MKTYKKPTVRHYCFLFEKYRMALKRDKDSIEIQKDDAIKRNWIFFDFMLRLFNNLNQLYEEEKSLLIHTILKISIEEKVW